MGSVEIDRFLEVGSESVSRWYDSSISTVRFDICSKFVESERSESGIGMKGSESGHGRLYTAAIRKSETQQSGYAMRVFQAREGCRGIIGRTRQRVMKLVWESQGPSAW